MTMHCGRLSVERYVCGELEGDAAFETRHHLEKCPQCSALAVQLETERTNFLKRHPVASFVNAHAAPISLPWYRRVLGEWSRPYLVPVVGVILVMVVILLPLNQNQMHLSKNGVLFKGAEAITYIYKRDGTVYQPSYNDLFREGDQVQILYSSSKRQYLILASIDTRGSISFYCPTDSLFSCGIHVDTCISGAYPVAIELDDAPGAELVVALFTENSLDTAHIATWIRSKLVNDKDLVRLNETLKLNHFEVNASISSLILTKE